MTRKLAQLGHLYTFFCPACKYGHNVTINGPHGWQWNLSVSKPTIRPSIMVNKEKLGNVPRCHSFITNGMIQFLEDSTHELAGKVAVLPDWPEVDANVQKELPVRPKTPTLGSGEPTA